MGLLDGRVAIVTGAGAGIGRGVAARFAAEGASVVAVEVDVERCAQLRATLPDIAVVEADVQTPDGVAATFAAAHEAGGADVLVNNVGHYGVGRGPFHEQPESEWAALHAVNFEHVMRCSQRFITQLLATKRPGSIVNVSTIEAFRGIPTRAVYSAYKAAITGFTKSLAVEYAHAGIRVNAIAPDVTETAQVPYSKWITPQDEAMIPTWVPLGRFGQPDDLAGVALFLASDLSAFVTGTTVHADGGTFAAGGWFPTAEGGWTNRPRTP